jgi:hypothetical protein
VKLSVASKTNILTVLICAAAAQASPVIWDLQGLTFSDGASGTGYFVFDADIRKFVDWNIVTTSSGTFAGYLYTPLTSIAVADSAGCLAGFAADAHAPFLCLNPASPLIAGATPDLLPSSNETYLSSRRFVSSGVLVDPPAGGGATVPEPATIGSIAFGIIAVIGFIRRRDLVGQIHLSK